MTKGRIELRRVNLLGYTPTTQMFLINSTMCNKEFKNGTQNTVDFLKSIAKWLNLTSEGYAIVATRLPKFKSYCAANGFEVIE